MPGEARHDAGPGGADESAYSETAHRRGRFRLARSGGRPGAAVAATDAKDCDAAAEFAEHHHSVLSSLGRQCNTPEARRGHTIGRTVLGAAGVVVFALLLAEQAAFGAAGRAGRSKSNAELRLKHKYRLDDGVQRFMRLADDTQNCKKSVFYEACIPALFGQVSCLCRAR